MSTIVAHDLNSDESFIRAIWLTNKKQVISHMSKMMQEGWHVTVDGLISESNEFGTVIARPLRVKSNAETTGIGIFKFNNRE